MADKVVGYRGLEDPHAQRRRQLVAGPVVVTAVAGNDCAAIDAFETAALRLVLEHLAYINKPEVRSPFKVLGARLEGSYPDTLLVISIRWSETMKGEDEYALWKGYPFQSGEEAGELIAAWVGENN
ncbi:MAG: hypothetical protein ACJ760_09490 [Thermoleophilaceae bacterium]